MPRVSIAMFMFVPSSVKRGMHLYTVPTPNVTESGTPSFDKPTTSLLGSVVEQKATDKKNGINNLDVPIIPRAKPSRMRGLPATVNNVWA